MDEIFSPSAIDSKVEESSVGVSFFDVRDP